jgi:hypothetical protein
MREVDFLDARFDDSLGAGGRAAIMAAGLKSYINGRPAGEFARVTQRHHLGMSIPRALRPPPTYNDAVTNHNRTDSRIRATNPYRKQGMFKRKLQIIHTKMINTPQTKR